VHLRLSSGEDADVIVGRWKWEENVISRAEVVALGSLAVPVPRTSDLILLKLAAGGPLDLQDVVTLIEIHGKGIVPEVEAHIDDVRPAVRKTWEDLLAAL